MGEDFEGLEDWEQENWDWLIEKFMCEYPEDLRFKEDLDKIIDSGVWYEFVKEEYINYCDGMYNAYH